MFGWMTEKLKTGRIAMSIVQLEVELNALSDGELALVVVLAIEFATSLAVNGSEAASRASEMPDSLNVEDAYELYWILEGMLIEAQKQNATAFTNTKQRMGIEFAEKFRKEIKLSETALRLLLSRIAVSIDKRTKDKLRKIALRIDGVTPILSEATTSWRLRQSAVGAAKSDAYYASIEVRAKHYAASFIVSIYGAAQ